MKSITITRPDDWHLHLRDSPHMQSVVADSARRFARAIVMPNLKPPVTKTADALAYRDRILGALPAGSRFTPLMTLYLTDKTHPTEIERAKASGCVHAVKYYPAGATTNSDAGVTDIARCYGVFEAMAAVGIAQLVAEFLPVALVHFGADAGVAQLLRERLVFSHRFRVTVHDGDENRGQHLALAELAEIF